MNGQTRVSLGLRLKDLLGPVTRVKKKKNAPPGRRVGTNGHDERTRCSQFENNYFTEMCSGSEAGSYLRLIDFGYHSTLGLREIKKEEKKQRREGPSSPEAFVCELFDTYAPSCSIRVPRS